MEADGNNLYLGGQFTSLGGQPEANLGAIDLTTGLVKGWMPFTDALVFDIAVSGSTLFAGGYFRDIGGTAHQYFAGVGAVASVLVDVPSAGRPDAFEFSRISPNPSTGSVQIEYVLPRATHVRVTAYDVQGRLVRRLEDRERPAGRYSTTWDAARASETRASGLYFLRIEALGRSVTQRVVFIR
jgi:hypothetical protein